MCLSGENATEQQLHIGWNVESSKYMQSWAVRWRQRRVHAVIHSTDGLCRVHSICGSPCMYMRVCWMNRNKHVRVYIRRIQGSMDYNKVKTWDVRTELRILSAQCTSSMATQLVTLPVMYSICISILDMYCTCTQQASWLSPVKFVTTSISSVCSPWSVA